MTELYKYILAVAVAALTLAACDKEDTEPKAVRDYPSFSATIESRGTRAYDTFWETGDAIGIYGGGATNISHTHQGNGSFKVTKDTEQIVFTDNSEVEFTAYYPYGTPSTDSKYPGKIANYGNSNLPTQTPANQKKFDYLWAEATKGSTANPDVKFRFTHRMSKITLVFESDEIDVSNITAYSVDGLYLRGTLDPKDGTCEKYGNTSGKITVTVKNFNVTIENRTPAPPIIIFPQELKSNPLSLTVTATAAGIGTITGSLNFPDGKLKSGDEYRFNIKVSKTGLSVGKATIKSWVPEDLGEKEAS